MNGIGCNPKGGAIYLIETIQTFLGLTPVILAGGLATRLRKVVSDRPKVLCEVGNRPFLSYLLDQLANADFKYVVICTGYMGEQIRTFFGDKYKTLQLIYSQERDLLGTAGALRLAMPFLQSDHILVMNGDSYHEADLPCFWVWHKKMDSKASLILTKVSDVIRYGRVSTDVNGSVVQFCEKDQKGGPGYINAGIYLLDHNIIRSIPKDKKVSLEHNIFPRLIGRGLYGYKSQGPFIDIGIPEDFEKAEQFFHTKCNRIKPSCFSGERK